MGSRLLRDLIIMALYMHNTMEVYNVDVYYSAYTQLENTPQ